MDKEKAGLPILTEEGKGYYIMEGLIVNQWSKIFEMELNRTYDADFEIFGEKAQNPSNAEVDFYVGIKKEMNG
ncbi:hypothetical protein [Zunongwangia sp. HRR-M8]|uniref:hypothetical protein n=1 Tax=Zunongwangia sp. HRR-M8 TaxID=3015170 RepID=UPI0022DE7A39|nr:hypothetical protein [Zunongwangia sp. HRR-M8]WBL23796.1 hypothetical protein PBT89_07500 [Zunongwangia sp. HRR-M8]